MVLNKKELKEVLPFLGGLLLVLGFIKLYLFYNNFGINISEYIEFSEILVAFLPNMLGLSIIIIIGFLNNFILTSVSEFEIESKLKNEIIETIGFTDKLKKHYKLNPLLFLGTIILLMIYSFSSYINSLNANIFRNASILFIAILVYQILWFEISYKYKKLYENEISQTYSNLILIVYFLTIYNIFFTYSNIEKIEKSEGTKVSFCIDDDYFKSDSDNIYIGQCKEYLFMYNKKNKEAKVFKRSDITNLILKEK